MSQGICFNGVTGPLHPAIAFYSSSRTVTVTRCEELAIGEVAAVTAGGAAVLPCFDLLESRCVVARAHACPIPTTSLSLRLSSRCCPRAQLLV